MCSLMRNALFLTARFSGTRAPRMTSRATLPFVCLRPRPLSNYPTTRASTSRALVVVSFRALAERPRPLQWVPIGPW
jgi:hypothetical protein